MATFRLKVSGQIVEVPDGLNLGGAQDWLQQQGISREEVGLPPAAAPEVANQVEGFDVGAGKWLADRIPGMDNSAPYPPGLGSAIGQAAIPFLASLAVPGSGAVGIASQGALAGGLEAARKGATGADIASQGAFAAGGTALGNLASRVVTGITTLGKAAANRQVVQRTSDTLRMAAEGTGGGRLVDAVNRRAVNSAAAASIYQKADNLSSDVLGQAADDIGRLFDQASPKSYNPDPAKQIIDAIPDASLPGKKRLLELLGRSDAYTQTHRVLRDLERNMSRNPQLSAWAPEVDAARQALEQSGQGADQALLTRAREGWKNLRILEGIREVVDTGNLPATRGAGAFSSETTGYGTSYKRGTTAGTQPETQDLITKLKTLAANKAAPTSGTAERAVATVGVAGILAAVASGEMKPEDAAKLIAAAAVVSPSIAAASVGRAPQVASSLGAVLGQEAGKRITQ